MRTTTLRVIALISVVGFTMAAKSSIKQKLAEKGSNLAQAGSQSGDIYTGIPIISAPSAPGCGCGCPTSCPAVCPTNLVAPDCECEAPPLPILNPGPGNATLTTTLTNVLSSQSLGIVGLPENSFTDIENSVCCSCKNSIAEEHANATKSRRFCIQGDICVTETVCFLGNSCAAEASTGRAESELQGVHIPNGGLGAGIDDCFNVTVCPLDTNGIIG